MVSEIDLEADIRWPRFPYPGLRPFRITGEADESLIFCGRSNHRDDVLERLDASQFVSVVGPSGCGKSSLIKVGIIPVLKAGLLTRAGYDWQAIEMRPGQDPLENLAGALAKLNVPGDGPPGMEREEIAELLAAKRSALWMVVENMADRFQSGKHAAMPTRILLLLDQFEEIFSGIADPRAVDQFVNLITQFFRNPHPQLFIVLTMRTDFISQCANFPGLAEILNKTQYITPVLRGQGLIDAMERPARTYGGEIEPELIAAIVRDMGSGASYDADHLPLMQHALLWLWQQAWPETGLAEPPNPGMALPHDIPGPRLTLHQYQAHGGLHGILNRHANEIFAQLGAGPGGDRRSAIVEAMFRRLCERDASARYKRAPTYAYDVCRTTQCTADDLNAVIQPFAEGNTSFIELRPGHEADNPLLDLSHESLIRQWDRLRGWADAEAEKLAAFRKIASDAEDWGRHGKLRSFLKSGGQLHALQEWWHANLPTAAWANRYTLAEGNPDSLAHSLSLVEEFRDSSQRAHSTARHLRVGASILLGVAVVVGVWVVGQIRLAEARRGRIASVAMLESDANDHHRPEKALLIAVTFLGQRDAAGDLSKIEIPAYAALRDLHETRVLMANDPVFGVDWSPDGRWMVASASGRPMLWDAHDRAAAPIMLPVPDETAFYWRSLWRPGGNELLLVSRDRTATLVPLDTGAAAPRIRRDAVIRLGERNLAVGTEVGMAIFSDDGSKVVTGGIGSPLRVWDAGTGDLLAEGNRRVPQYVLAANEDGSLVAAPGNGGRPEVYAVSGASVAPLIPRGARQPSTSGQGESDACRIVGRKEVRALAFSPKDPRLLLFAIGCRVIAENVDSEDVMFQLTGYTTDINKIAFSKDGARIATSGEDGVVRLYDTPPYKADAGPQPARLVKPEILGAHKDAVYDLHFSPDGQFVLSGGRDNKARLWAVAPVFTADAKIAAMKPGEFVTYAKGLLPVGQDPLDPLVLCLIGQECQDTQSVMR